MSPNIVILGAGVTGLTTALTLAKEGRYEITVLAKHMPGDSDIEYASPWAGANYMPFSGLDTPTGRYEKATWPNLEQLAREQPESGVQFQDAFVYRRSKDGNTVTGKLSAELMKDDAWFKDMVPKFSVIAKDSLRPGIDGATAWTSVCINPALYLPWLVSHCMKHGVVFRRGTVRAIQEAPRLHHTGKSADVVVNCTGLGSREIKGVEDTTLYPARGQVVLARNNPGVMAAISGTDDNADEACYIMCRPGGGGCVLGGCLQSNNWDSQPDANLAIRIMRRAINLVPNLVPAGSGIEALDIIRHAVGLRPMREGGIRLETERKQGLTIVHNYGHGGYGYQTSYGCAQVARKLVGEALAVRPRL